MMDGHLEKRSTFWENFADSARTNLFFQCQGQFQSPVIQFAKGWFLSALWKKKALQKKMFRKHQESPLFLFVWLRDMKWHAICERGKVYNVVIWYRSLFSGPSSILWLSMKCRWESWNPFITWHVSFLLMHTKAKSVGGPTCNKKVIILLKSLQP